jgi:hypothetical protein
MNDADFEMLARSAAAGLIERGVKPYTLPDETWLRVRAMELSVQATQSFRTDGAEGEVYRAQKYFEFMKGSADENLHRQDQR